MIIVTGGADFIGSNIVKRLNGCGENDILVVVDLTDGSKFINLADCEIADYMDAENFHSVLEVGKTLAELSMRFCIRGHAQIRLSGMAVT